MGLTYSLTTGTEDLLILPEYQNEYAGGYSQEWIRKVDPEDGVEYNVLNYAADESWGPNDGTMYRPWWSWIHHDLMAMVLMIMVHKYRLRHNQIMLKTF